MNILKWLKDLVTPRNEFRAGYEYAMSSLQAGKSRQELEILADGCDVTRFDYGIVEAIHDWAADRANEATGGGK